MPPLRRLALLALALCLCVASATAAVSYTSYDELVTVLRSKPFDTAARDAILASLERSMPLYTFLPLNVDSALGAPEGEEIYNIKEDTMAALKQMAEREFASAYDMDEAFNRIFLPLLDAHTAYRKPYTGYAFALPLRLQSLQSASGAQQILLRTEATADAAYEQVYGASYLESVVDAATGERVPVASIDGFEVLQIEEEPVLTHLWKLATAGAESSFQVGVSKDAHTRFNLLVHGFTADPAAPPGYFSYRSQRSFGIPQDHDLVFRIRDPAAPERELNVVMQWIGMSPADDQHNSLFATLEARVPQHLRHQPVLQRQELEKMEWELHSLQHPDSYTQRQQLLGDRAGPRPAFRTEEPEQPVDLDALHARGLTDSEIPGEVSWKVLEDNTGVLRIVRFTPASVPKFLQFIQKVVTDHQNRLEGTRLIIDLRANGGGDICLGYAVLRFLFPQITNSEFSGPMAAVSPFGRYDFRHSNLVSYLVELGATGQIEQAGGECEFFTPCAWVNPDSETAFPNDKWYHSGREINRGGQTHEYSALVHDQCGEYFAGLAPADMNPGYLPKNVVLVSDGTCGSTCAVFSSYIQANHLAKTVVLGGVHSEQVDTPKGMQFSSFAGGQVADLSYLHELVSAYQVPLNDSRVPQLYPNGATQSFTLREIYAWHDHVGEYPLEFLRIPAHFHFLYRTPFTDSAGIYAQLQSSNLFGDAVCVDDVTDLECAVDNGWGERSCVAGVIGECEATDCIHGWEIVDNVCVPCKKGFYDDGSLICQQCPEPSTLSLPADGSVTCAAEFTEEAWPDSNCPFTITCSNQAPPAEPEEKASGYSAVVFFAVAGGLAALAVALLCVVLFQRRKISALAGAALDSEVGFHRMQ